MLRYLLDIINNITVNISTNILTRNKSTQLRLIKSLEIWNKNIKYLIQEPNKYKYKEFSKISYGLILN